MKKRMKSLILAILSFVVIGCTSASSLNGTYQLDMSPTIFSDSKQVAQQVNSQFSQVVTIQDTKVNGKLKTFAGEFDVTGIIDEKNKLITIEQLGYKLIFNYTVEKNGDLTLQADGQTFKWIKQK